MTTIANNIEPWASKFPQDQVKNILKLALDAWKTFDCQSTRLEVPITRRFCAHLRQNKDRSIHFFRIDWESPEIDNNSEEIGRIDLKFSSGLDEKVYFSIECKLLRVTRPSRRFETLANKYVTEGMYRYFNGQYATDLDKGGMLGYVMDGDTKQAIKDVKGAIDRRKTDLRMSADETLKACSVISSSQAKETCHNHGPDGLFTLYHIFLPIQRMN